jgi:hypothetical protein
MITPINKICSLLVIFLAFSISAFADETLPTAQDIIDAAQKAKQVYDSFFSQTLEIRMQYEYSGRFLNQQDKDTLLNAAKLASADLEQIANQQSAMKKTIEAYQKDDWETLFGQTGLWRKLFVDLLNTQTAKLEIDYYLARVVGNSKIDLQFFDTLAKSGLNRCAAVKASLEKIKYLGLSEPNELDTLIKSFEKSDCYDDLEMVLTLEILQIKYTPYNLQNTISRAEGASELFPKIILNDLSTYPDFNKLNPVAAQFAASAAMANNPVKYKDLLLALSDNDKLKSPTVLYAAGLSVADSSPQKAIKLMIESEILEHDRKPWFFRGVSPYRGAEKTAQLAYDYFNQKNIDCNLALEAFDNFAHFYPDAVNEKMQYFYGEILFDCGKTQQASEVFTKLANTSQYWRDEAALELLKIKIDTDSEKTLPQLRQFILNCSGQDKQKLPLRLEALDLYCRTLIARDNNDSAIQVLNLLDTAEQTPGLRYDLFKAQALYQSGRLEESAQSMSKAIIDDSGSMAPVAAHIVSNIVDRIELWQKDANDFNALLQNCDTLAEFANKSANTTQTNLLLAEVTILEGKKITWPLPSNDEGAIWPRVMARLLMQDEKFEQSAKLWTQIAESKRNESGRQNQKSYGWWQAKYYELACLAKSPQADKQNIAHAIDVLTGTYTQIPTPWPEKLDLLRKQCSAN